MEKKTEGKEEKTIYLVDGSSYIHRAYHAIRGLATSEGLPTNATFGFTRMLIKLLEDKSPEYLVILFDARAPTFRHERYEAYKANRPSIPEDLLVQIPYIKEIINGFNIATMEKKGYEADDLIGTLARKAEDEGFFVVMITGDKDFMQLVTDNTTIWDPMKDKEITAETIRETYGIEPWQMVDVMGLSGDTSDNIPGVPGVGMKTALNLIKTHRNMDTLYNQVDTITKPKQKQNLLEHKHQAYLSRDLVLIETKAPIEFDAGAFKRQAPDTGKLSKLFRSLEFQQLQKDFSQSSTEREKKNYQVVDNMDSLKALKTLLEKSATFALDTETTSQSPMKADLVGLSFSVASHEAFYVPVAHRDTQLQLEYTQVLNYLKAVLENPEIKKVGQNIKYDWLVLERHGAFLQGVSFDTMVASYLINPSKRAHNLDQIAMDFLNYKTITFEDVAGKGKNAVGFDHVPVEKAFFYACEDADITLMAARILKKRLEQIGLDELFETVEIPLIPVLVRMEKRGVRVDVEKLKILSKTFEHQLEQIENDIYTLAGDQFNINSSQQLGKILFEKLNLPIQKKTRKKTGYSTDVSVLTTLATLHEIPALVLKHRGLSKLKSTYSDALVELVNPDTGRIHTSYNQTVTATGRLSSSDPNLQNIPIRTEDGRQIRSAFIPKEGWFLVSADYSQIELRILAHYSGDEILIKSFLDNEDIHTRTATEIFQVFPSMIDAELRRQAKIINFGIIYGMGPFRLSKELGISQKMAKTYIQNYFSRYQGVKRFIDDTKQNARQTCQTSTLLNRIRLLPEINSTNKIVREAAERIAINTPIQGTAADLIKLAMINVDTALRQKKLSAAMLMTVHDELIFEIPPDELEVSVQLIRDVMETVWKLDVPLKVNIDKGKNWAEAH
jgi:DNA polymerase-1